MQQKIDTTKWAYRKIEAEQQALSATSAAPISAKPDFEALLEAEATDPVPAAVASFINTLGVDLTEEQQLQLQNMLKRPTSIQDEDAKRRKTEAPNNTSGGQPWSASSRDFSSKLGFDMSFTCLWDFFFFFT